MIKYSPSAKPIPLITRLFSFMINEQLMPAGFNVSVLKPIIKNDKNPNDDISNTRPVAISSIQNLFERVLLMELNKTHKEHEQQFGLKRNSSCSHAVFTIYQAANYAKVTGRRLYTYAVDASKTFDKVSGPHLWKKLIEKGVEVSIILAIIHYYNDSFMIVQLEDEFSEVFRTTMGVRQGGVLSPKLFAIFVDDLMVELEATGLGLEIGNMKITVIMYADDLLLMTETKKRMCDLLLVAENYGAKHGINFNPDKTELLIFNHMIKRTKEVKREWVGTLKLGGNEIKIISSFRYLEHGSMIN